MKIIKEPIIKHTNGATISYVDEDGKGEECVIYNVFVPENVRHMGIATKMIKDAIKDIFKHGYDKLFLVCDLDLVFFYSDLGFVVVNLRKDHKVEMYHYKNIF